MTRTEIRDLFQRHRGEAEIDRALEVLVRLNLTAYRPESTTGRSAERWTVTKATEATKGQG
jgi:hypothetical protein